MNIRTINLIWEQRFRSAYPVSRFGLSNEGTLTLAVPHPLEARTYDLSHLRLNGEMEVKSKFAVETLLKMEAGSQGADGIGMTSDDLYLFRGGSKSRFLGEKRLTYVDAALSEDGQRFAAGFTDMAGDSFALAYGEINGKVVWTQDVNAALSAVAISRDGKRIAFGAENGMIWLTDSFRRSIWVFGQEQPIRALACSSDGIYIAYGTAEGTVGLIDGDGVRVWEAVVQGEVIALALSGEGDFCAALTRTQADPGNTRLACIPKSGQVGWEFVAEKRLLSLSLSPNGNYLATGARDGTHSVYEVVLGEAPIDLGASPNQVLQAKAEGMVQEGDWKSALTLLQNALDASPTNADLCDYLGGLRQQWQDHHTTELEKRQQGGDFVGVIELADTMLQTDPYHPTVVTYRNNASLSYSQQLLSEANLHQQAKDFTAAEVALLEAIRVSPLLSTPRRALATLRSQSAIAADTEADTLLAKGDLAGGIVALEQAQSLAPTPERAAKLQRVQIAQEFTVGVTFYNEKRYSEAIFQFKKTLAQDPGHTEAQRYLSYSQKFLQDSANDTLNDRFSRLE